jgi:excisionase family DNA binding protein
MQLSTGQAAQRLGVSSERIRQLVHQGELAATVTPLGRLFSEADVDKLADVRRRRRAAAPLQFIGAGAPGAA